MPLSFHHLVSIRQLSRADADLLLSHSAEMESELKKGRCDRLAGRILASLFYEPSTRTRLSFETAMLRLGGQVITADGMQSSSIAKGESIEDTMRMAAQYADVIALRHPEGGIAERAAAASSVPFINAGDGGNEHPTQSLLDLYTIRKELGKTEGLHVAFACDPLHSRSLRSLALLLSLYPGNRFTFISPASLCAAPELLADLRAKGIECAETTELRDGVDADILYMNRLQKERFTDLQEFEANRLVYRLTADMLKGKSVLVMDPLPRVDQIALDVDALPNAVYFRQAGNGVPLRMALLDLLLSA